MRGRLARSGHAGGDPEAGGWGTAPRHADGARSVHSDAVLQVLQPQGDPTCSDGRDGFRPEVGAPGGGASAARRGAGDGWVVDLDLEICCDWVNQDTRMSLVKGSGLGSRVAAVQRPRPEAGALTDEAWRRP